MITCGFVGLGLIGGSIARALKANRKDIVIIACDPNEETLKLATEQKIADEAYPAPCDAFTACDYIFLCAPVSHNDENLLKILSYRKKDCILTDVGSVKTPINSLIHSLGLTDCFIGGHPMAGSEKTGLANAREFLLENAYYILTPTAQTDPAALEDFKELVASLGAIPMVLDYEQHDYATAAISHLPHIIAYSLVNLVKSCDDCEGTMKTIAAGGFKDITRIASSSPVMWENICLSNQEQILRLIDSFCGELGHMRSAIAASDSKALMEAFTSAKDYRDSLTLHANGTLKQVYELYMDLLDEAGGIATVATILASHHLSIKNIGIIHNREFEDGVLHLEMYDSESLAAAITLLKKHHYTIYER